MFIIQFSLIILVYIISTLLQSFSSEQKYLPHSVLLIWIFPNSVNMIRIFFIYSYSAVIAVKVLALCQCFGLILNDFLINLICYIVDTSSNWEKVHSYWVRERRGLKEFKTVLVTHMRKA